MNRLFACITALALAAIASVAVAADTAPKKTLTLAGAKKVLAAAQEYARQHNAPGGAIAIVDESGNLMLLERLDGTFAAASSVSTGKARTSVMFGKPTRLFEDLVNKGRTTMVALPDVTPFTPLQGGVPIEIDGQIVGAIGVSGASSAQQDDEIAQAGADAFAKMAASSEERVQYLNRDQVSEAFKKGAPLLRGPAYKVDASRRDAPGEAEIHLVDTDIFYVQRGSATFVTGGDIVKGYSLAPNEIRGQSILNGETHELKKGDIIVVPSGTPHWFKSVSGPFTYYVVKATG